jgi:hypothetical protein
MWILIYVSKASADRYRLPRDTRAAHPTTFRFTGSFEISEALILTPIGRTPNRVARCSANRRFIPHMRYAGAYVNLYAGSHMRYNQFYTLHIIIHYNTN